MNGDGTGRHAVTDNDAVDGDPTWSPDGKRIYFTSMRDTGGKQSYLYVMNADGSNQRPVGSQIQILGRPAVSPDGMRILFTGPTADGPQLFTVAANGGTPTPLGQPNCAEPTWSADGLQILLTSWRDSDNAQLYRRDLASGSMTRLTNDLDDDGGAAW